MSAPWPLVPLGDILAVNREYVTSLEDRDYPKLSVRLYGKGAVPAGSVAGTSVKMKRHQIARAGQIILSEIWGKKGAIGVVPSEGEGALCTSHFFLFDPDKAKVDIGWLRWVFSGNLIGRDLADGAKGTTGYAAVRPHQFQNVSIPLPPLSEQRRIVALLDQVARRVEEARRLSEEAASEREALLLRQVEELAKGAPRRLLSEVAPIVRRAVEVDPETWYPELGIRSFGKGTFHKPPILGAELGGKRIFHIEPGDLLLSNVFAWEGAIAVVQPEDEGRYGSHRFITCLVDRTQATPEFLCRYFLTDEGMAAIRAASPGAAGRNRTLGIGKLAAIPVPVPPVDAQRRFADLAARVRAADAARQAAIEALDTLMSAALARAFHGEL
jgi:type I restriction enzyme S subunit